MWVVFTMVFVLHSLPFSCGKQVTNLSFSPSLFLSFSPSVALSLCRRGCRPHVSYCNPVTKLTDLFIILLRFLLFLFSLSFPLVVSLSALEWLIGPHIPVSAPAVPSLLPAHHSPNTVTTKSYTPTHTFMHTHTSPPSLSCTQRLSDWLAGDINSIL